MATLKDIETRVFNNPDVSKSAIELINGIADLLDSLTHDPVAIKKASEELRGSASTMAAAVVANTGHAEKTVPAKAAAPAHPPAHPHTPKHK